MADDLKNAARDAEILLCNVPGTEHDYRPFVSSAYGNPTYLRCVWCHAVACGNYASPDSCIEVWHHEPKPHRTASGATWPIGGSRSDPSYPPVRGAE